MTPTSAAFDARAFRDALGAFPTGVAVVLAQDGPDRVVAITINSFASVSLDPPLVLWSIGRSALRSKAFCDADALTINVLSIEQEAVARRFAAEAGARADDPVLARGATGALAIVRANAVFDCVRHALVPAGDHDVWIGRVRALEGPRESPALTYFRSRYGRAD